jgi:hypothetical protein
MKYLLLLAGEPGVGPAPGSDEFMQMLADYQSATEGMAAAGVLVDSGPLQDPSTATTVRIRDGQRLVTDGPFAEIREQLGGYYVIECADLDNAVDWAAKIPAARYGSIEVRPLMMEIPH